MAGKIVRGTYVEIPFAAFDTSGNAIDMTVSGRSLVMRMRLLTSTTVSITKTTGVSGEASWTSQSGGTGQFIFSTASSLAAALGRYQMEVAYIATAESKVHVVHNGGVWEFVDPATGAL